MSINLVTLLYLLASVCFIQALKGLSNPRSARAGNAFGIVGMIVAVCTTMSLIFKQAHDLGSDLQTGFSLVLFALVVGGTVGAVLARRVEMTKMPELVAAMHSLIGLAAVCIAYAVVSEPQAFGLASESMPKGFLPFGNRIELVIGTFVGAITFSGSVIAFAKLSGKYKFRLFQGAPVVYPVRRHVLFDAGVDVVPDHDCDRICPRRSDHYSHWRCGHACCGVDAELVLRVGRSRYRFFAQQCDAHYRRLTRRLVGRNPIVHHV
jgi:NAD/NADP transhydrogenase beta subunit